MAGPLVSVVVTTYFRNDQLRAAVDSALGQTHEPVEVIVVDGSGQAHAREAIAADPDVTYLAQQRDRGPQAARSLGAEHACGRYVQFLDDDDRLRENKIARQLDRFERDVRVVYAGLEDEAYGTVRPDPEVRGDVLDRALAMNTFPCIPSTMLLERSLVDELLPLRHRHGADDTGMKIELARRSAFDYVDEPLVERGRPEEPLARSWAHVEGRMHLLDVYEDLYEAFPDEVRRTALRQTLYRAGRKRLEERTWSPAATADLARAAWHTPDDRSRFVREAVASLAGRPGLRLAERLAE